MNRDEQGRFTDGNPGGPGRPLGPREVELEYFMMKLDHERKERLRRHAKRRKLSMSAVIRRLIDEYCEDEPALAVAS